MQILDNKSRQTYFTKQEFAKFKKDFAAYDEKNKQSFQDRTNDLQEVKDELEKHK